MGFSIGEFLEKTGSIYLQGESLKNERQQFNRAEDFQRIESGVDSDGSTIRESQLISGVNNNVLLGAVVGLVALVAIVIAAGD